jgi:hypothetical protein
VVTLGVCGIKGMKERRVEKKGGMINRLGENGEELVGTNKYLCVQKKGSLCTNKIPLWAS